MRGRQCVTVSCLSGSNGKNRVVDACRVDLIKMRVKRRRIMFLYSIDRLQEGVNVGFYIGAVPIAASPYLRGFAKGLAEIKTVDYCQKWQKRLL